MTTAPSLPVLPVEALVDPLCGIVRRLVDVEPVPGLPERYTAVTAEVADARRFGAWPADRVSLGTTFGDREGARTAALGEAVERYCGNRVPPGLPFTTAAELRAAGERVWGTGELPLFTAGQLAAPGFPYTGFTEDLAVRWIAGVEEDGDRTWLPASWVLLNHHSGQRRREPRFHHLNYAGIATGADATDAFRRGLLELVERDALERWWHLGLPSHGIDPATVPGLDAALTGASFAVHLVELPTEYPVSCVAAVVVDPATGIVAGGGAARFDPAEAATKAVLEAVHTWVFTRGLLDPDGWVFASIDAGVLARGLYLDHRADRRYRDDAGPGYAAVRDLGAQVQVWLDPRVQEQYLDRFTAPATSGPLATGPAGDLPALRAALAADGHRVARVDLTTPDVGQTRWRVVRTCATGLVPNAPAAFRYRGLPRWGKTAARYGRDGAFVDAPPPFL
ncbi:YcaO-like family protein [Pseudonocardia phyllosphaerae]|uniref:YcaO-like family protein n=1 Tax=Pseudonocardia phyllosphaerae TaxID=3390502 RepID=UPI00397B51A9